ncbi:MAG: AsnC family transcriptional regulator [Roseibium sp.]|uniref:Lrp/AsnC family transcriptional regulator n=1 Tax=Roseibium sp. TaxID=1936156 RepID=UPI001B2425A4|nr:AsnC family transcriptional regulator [Roseibium sp.]MBO6895265.1 AsnC family transcriptional regulator [Roseibium sp.]MBO6929799.1 AsnC family transcriptional regulator [Roseibium sp.]
MTADISDLDRKLINCLQDDLPLTSSPFSPIASQLGISEEEVIERTRRLRDDGLLTRFGPFFDAEALGGAFCLCAMAVPADRFEEVLTKVNAFSEVAHNYERNHRLNMWFVLATETKSDIARTTAAIERETGLQVLLFPKEQEFFIGFRVNA